MTIRRRPDTDELQVKPDGSAISFRLIITIAVVSMHPLGQQMLTQMGFTLPSSNAALHKDVDEVKTDLAALKQDVQVVKHQMTSFEVNFDKFKKQVMQ